MEATTHVRGGRGRGRGLHDNANTRPHSRNKQWVANPDGGHKSGRSSPYHSDGEGKWERGGHRGGRGNRGTFRGGGRGKFQNATLRVNNHPTDAAATSGTLVEQEVEMESPTVYQPPARHPELEDTFEGFPEIHEPVLETKEEREQFWQELVKAREVERKTAIAEGKMDDPTVPKRLEDAICVIGTCPDMCPRFERYRRERENNLFEWEVIPGTKRVDHQRAVKMYERAAGDKTLPSDLRPPQVLRKTLDYLFHDLLPRGGFSPTFNFIRDRSRAVRNDFTMQHNHGPVAIECHDRCARFHILALHLERDREGFSIPLEEQQLMNTLQSLKEFYEEQRTQYESPTELEMRVYHRLIHIRDQRERHDEVPQHIQNHPFFKLTTDFRLHVQRKSAPITKTSKLVVDQEAMQIFGKLADVLREQGNVVMIYLVACILERHFGKDAIEDIEVIRGALTLSDIIDGVSIAHVEEVEHQEDFHEDGDMMQDDFDIDAEPAEELEPEIHIPSPTKFTTNAWQNSAFSSGGTSAFGNLGQRSNPSQPASAFASISYIPNAFAATPAFGPSTFSLASATPQSAFGGPTFTVKPSSALPAESSAGAAKSSVPNVFGQSGSLQPPSPQLPQPQGPAITKSRSPPAASNGFNFGSPQPSEKAQGLSLFGDSQIFRKSQTNGFTFPSLPSQGESSGSLFVLGTPPISAQPSSSSGQAFMRSTNPSPSPFALGSSAPVTPAETPNINGAPSPIPIPLPRPMRTRKSSTPPVLPKIDTLNTTTFTPMPPPTPSIPPPTPKQQPISLPSTPTIGPQPSNPLLYRIHDQLKTPVTASPNDMLSPIALQSPSPFSMPSLNNFPATSKAGTALGLKTSFPSPMITSPTKPAFFNQPPQFQTALPTTTMTPESGPEAELNAKADEFLGRIVKSAFERWHQLILDRAAYLEAVQQGDNYREKIKRQSHFEPDRKRKVSSLVVSGAGSPAKKRSRRRMSSTYKPPRTDEELAQRLKKNHAEHERRWAQGTFLQVIQRHAQIKLAGSSSHPSWRTWLSMNPDVDATAIWLERKFNVPNSGTWATESVFSIPLANPEDTSGEAGSPGLIVLECTPLEDTTDDIERKYRILDDCSRLRDAIAALPEKHYFRPSLLLLTWSEDPFLGADNDLNKMVQTLLTSETIKSYSVFSISMVHTDLDEQLETKLASLNLDLQGELARTLSWQSIFKLFESQYVSFTSEWLDNCVSHGQFNWRLFNDLIIVVIGILNKTVETAGTLIGKALPDLLPPITDSHITDDDSAYEKLLEWMSSADGGVAVQIIFNIQSRRDIGHEFPVRDLLDQLWGLVLSESWDRLGTENTKHYVLKTDIALATNALKHIYDQYQRSLGQTLHMSVRRSPARSIRRRSVSQDTELTSTQPKRPRLSSPTPTDTLFGEDDYAGADSPPGINGQLSPTPSTTSATPSEPPVPTVTIAMLRALTRDIKQKYGSST